MMTESGKLDIVVVGGSQVGKNAVLMRVLGVQDAPRQPSFSWTIDNKYYTATTSLGAVHVDDLAARPKAQADWEAIILVFDVERQESFEKLKIWDAAVDTASAEIKICVGNKADLLRANGAERGAWLAGALEWCLEEEYEYVEVSATDLEHDLKLGQGEDQQGMARVVAALHAHTWPGLQRKPMPSAQALSSEAARDEASGSCLPVSADGADGCGTSIMRRQQQGIQEPLNGPGEGATSEGEVEPADERALEQFEAMLSSLAGSRDHLKDLPDDDRRTLAADFAMKMLGALGIEDDTESDDEV